MTEQGPDAFVERDDQLQALVGWAAEAAAGRGRVVVVSGEAGIGKTTLVDHLRAAMGEVEWWQGNCDSVASQRAFGPVHDMAPLLGDAAGAALRADDRNALFDAVLQRVRDNRRPCLLVVEDVHWADEATLDLLQFLGRRIGDEPLMVVATSRDGQSAPPPARGALGEIARLPAYRRLALDPLTEGGVERLCGGRADARELHRLTGGNPYYVTQMLHHRGGDQPPSIRDAVLGQLADLAPAEVAALRLAAVAGDRALRAHVADLLPGDTQDALARQGFLVDAGVGCRFRHEIARQAIADDIPARWRRELHREVLEALAGTDDHALLAHHADGAGAADKTLHHAGLAAASAVRVGSVREAVHHYRLALAVAPNGDSATIAELQDGLADALALMDESNESMAVRRQALEHWTTVGDPVRQARSLGSGAWVERAVGRTEVAEASTRRAISLLEPLGPSADLAQAHLAMARLLGLGNKVSGSLHHVEIGRGLARQLGLDSLDAELLNVEACCRALLGQEWEDLMARAEHLARTVPDQSLVARAHYNQCCLLVHERNLAAADDLLPEVVAHAESHHLHAYLWGFRRLWAATLLHRGRWDDAVAQLRADQAGVQSPAAVAERDLILGTIAARRDEESAPLLNSALESAEHAGQPQFLVPVRLARAEAAWLGGDLEQAEKEIRHARDVYVEQVHLIRDLAVWAHRIGMPGDDRRLSGAAADELGGRAAVAARAWDRTGSSYDAALALLGADDPSLVRDAVLRLDDLGAAAAARLARGQMRELGVRAVPPEPRASTRAHPKGLTVREQEVLDLVADGLRNADIASRLFLSPKTVAVHLTSIYRKLGVLNRGEAAAWAREHAEPAGSE